MMPQNFCDCGGPWSLWYLGFFMNHLKLVNSIPALLPSFWYFKFYYFCLMAKLVESDRPQKIKDKQSA